MPTVTGTLNEAGQTLTIDANSGSFQMQAGTILGGTISTSGGSQLLVPTSAFVQVVGRPDVESLRGILQNVHPVHRAFTHG
jgi:hypothetical protein